MMIASYFKEEIKTTPNSFKVGVGVDI